MMASSAPKGACMIIWTCWSMGIALPSGSEDPPEGRGAYRQSSAVAENGIFRLTSKRHVGDHQDANRDVPRLCRTCRPAHFVAGLFVCGRDLSSDPADDCDRHPPFRPIAGMMSIRSSLMPVRTLTPL